MQTRVSVSHDDLVGLVGRLEVFRAELDLREQAALDALVALAGEGIAAQTDVVGFGGGQWSWFGQGMSLNFSLPAVQSQQGVLIGLLRNGGNQMQDMHFAPTPGQGASS